MLDFESVLKVFWVHLRSQSCPEASLKSAVVACECERLTRGASMLLRWLPNRLYLGVPTVQMDTWRGQSSLSEQGSLGTFGHAFGFQLHLLLGLHATGFLEVDYDSQWILRGQSEPFGKPTRTIPTSLNVSSGRLDRSALTICLDAPRRWSARAICEYVAGRSARTFRADGPRGRST